MNERMTETEVSKKNCILLNMPDDNNHDENKTDRDDWEM